MAMASKATFRILIVIYGAFNDTIVCDDEQLEAHKMSYD